MDKKEARSSMVLDEVKSTCKRISLVTNNSSNPVDVFLASQVSGVLDNLVAEISSMLANPNIDATAEQFVKMIQEKR